MENERIYNLMEKMYREFSEFRKEMTEFKTEMTEFKTETGKRFDKVEESISKFENETVDKIKALFDAREVQTDVNEKILSTLGRIEAKVDVLQMETAHIRRIK
ncbi:hypothetical protein BR63_06905 [Thermanaerosceptrum fracticalcis]|uniref:Uncharacterized protein n=1 Tax=Thermanaerosceptrum fracticalcis TaxID=1712410 RepID=A0A7G6E1W5_THEFR|nr:hypothetical protein [Thermanaerosceptrum fracticalcis]QNB46069.1 hypothetical protein BR63_06905 [Thermanaerosceptrum fracticalcis]